MRISARICSERGTWVTNGKARPYGRTTNGFTLLEMLVATAMVAVLAGSLYASLYIAFKARGTALGSVESVRKAHQTIDLLRADLQSAVIPSPTNTTSGSTGTTPPPLLLAGPFQSQSGQGVFGNGGDGLTFYSTAADTPGDAGIGDIKKIEYACEAAADTGELSLVRRTTTNLLAPVITVPKPEILCRGIKSFSLQYYDGTAWQPSWDSTTTTMLNSLPLAVKATIMLADVQKKNALGNVETTPGETVEQVLPITCGAGLVPSSSTGGTP